MGLAKITATGLLNLAIWTMPTLALGQSSFDVTSVKRHDPRDQSFRPPTCSRDRFTAHSSQVSEILTWAYDLRIDQFHALEDSLPSWAKTEAYDFEGVAGKPIAASECKSMVKQMLLTRFKVRSHWKRIASAPGYELRVGPKGHKLKLVSATDIGCGVHIADMGQERPCDRYQFPFAPKRAMTMQELAKVLSIYTSREPVRDMTGLSGEYKINLSFALRSDDARYPSLETALQEQLGLAMRRANGDVDILIVDSIDRPTAN